MLHGGAAAFDVACLAVVLLPLLSAALSVATWRGLTAARPLVEFERTPVPSLALLGVCGRPAPRVDEKVPANYYHGVAGKVWFLPYADSVTKDTPEIRAALRQMRKDGYVKAAWEPQIAAVASEDWQVQPAEPGNPEAEEQAEFVTRVFQDYLRGGMPSLVRAVCAPLGSDGFSVAEKVWAVGAKGRLEGKIVLEAAKPKEDRKSVV